MTLPPIGAVVRCRGGGVGVVEKRVVLCTPKDSVFVRWPEGGGAWFTADELSEAT